MKAEGPSPAPRETKPEDASVTLSKNPWNRSITHEKTTLYPTFVRLWKNNPNGQITPVHQLTTQQPYETYTQDLFCLLINNGEIFR
jgi:hypothetical protein